MFPLETKQNSKGEQMKKLISATLIALVATTAKADGFVCESVDSDIRIKVYNQTQADEGTRSPAVMIVSDPQVGTGRKTIAKFSTETGSLSTSHHGSLKYLGDVDLRYNDMGRAGEYLMGTRLGEVDLIKLTIDFTYGDNLENGAETAGRIVVVKRDGETAVRDAVCTRYLKGE